MNDIITLLKRHIKNYLRDKASVFFSFLSVIILLAIYMLFLGKQFSDLPMLTSIQKAYFSLGYIMGGVLVVNTVTLSLGVIGTYVIDIEQKKIDGFFVTPLKRYKYIVSYYIATTLVTLVFSLLMLFAVVVYLGLTTTVWYPLTSILSFALIVTLYVFISSPIMIFIASFLKSNNALGAVASIVGTAIGFISGIYIPLTMLDSVTQSIAALLPFSHMTVYLRKILIGNDIIALLPEEAINGFALIDLKLFNYSIPTGVALALSTALAFALLIVAYFKVNKKHK